jgi:hypothetical protein
MAGLLPPIIRCLGARRNRQKADFCVGLSLYGCRYFSYNMDIHALMEMMAVNLHALWDTLAIGARLPFPTWPPGHLEGGAAQQEVDQIRWFCPERNRHLLPGIFGGKPSKRS